MKIFEFREFSKKIETDQELISEFWESFISVKYPNDIKWNSDKIKTVPDIKFDDIRMDILTIIEKIQNQCGNFTEDLKKANSKTNYFKFFWRGISKMGEVKEIIKSNIPFKSIDPNINMVIKSTRDNRNPVDTPKGIHNKIDNLFYDKFGSHLRSKSVFTFPDIDLNKSYGDQWMVFPIGKYEIFWSNEISDLWNYLDKIWITTPRGSFQVSQYHLWENDEVAEMESSRLFADIVDKYTEGHMDEVIENPFIENDLKEVMIDCKQYFLIHEVFDIPISFYVRGEIDMFFKILKEVSS